MTLSAEQWVERLASLRVSGEKGNRTPHKPLLLLVLLELAEKGALAETVELTPQLAYQFCAYWGVVAHRRNRPPDVRYPFYHLEGDGFWTPTGGDGELLDRERRFHARYGRLDSGLLALAQDAGWRERARRVLIATYFQPQERSELYALVGLPVPTEEEIACDARYRAPDRPPVNGRVLRFRLDVVAAYKYTCALTRYRLLTIDAGAIVDAAHIQSFADSRNNDIQNGLALSKNAHWLFDNGLWTLTDDYRVQVAPGHFDEDNHGAGVPLLADYHGREILLPDNPALRPDPKRLAWHRKNRFLGA
jgi:putative restriction endonuclease